VPPAACLLPRNPCLTVVAYNACVPRRACLKRTNCLLHIEAHSSEAEADHAQFAHCLSSGTRRQYNNLLTLYNECVRQSRSLDVLVVASLPSCLLRLLTQGRRLETRVRRQLALLDEMIGAGRPSDTWKSEIGRCGESSRVRTRVAARHASFAVATQRRRVYNGAPKAHYTVVRTIRWLSGSGGGRPGKEVISRTPSAPRALGLQRPCRAAQSTANGRIWTDSSYRLARAPPAASGQRGDRRGHTARDPPASARAVGRRRIPQAGCKGRAPRRARHLGGELPRPRMERGQVPNGDRCGAGR
jgi:hypothetical protein